MFSVGRLTETEFNKYWLKLTTLRFLSQSVPLVLLLALVLVRESVQHIEKFPNFLGCHMSKT